MLRYRHIIVNSRNMILATLKRNEEEMLDIGKISKMFKIPVIVKNDQFAGISSSSNAKCKRNSKISRQNL
jgi:hypothetical protein